MMSVVNISMSEARNLVLQNMQTRQASMSRAGRQVKTFWGYWNNSPVYLTIGQAMDEVRNRTDLGNFILTVELNGIAQQTGTTYQITG
jgi:hypothetical protein